MSDQPHSETLTRLIPVRITPCITRLVDAPGFTAHSFAAALDRAREHACMRIQPIGGGRVWVAARHGGWYVVSRQSCDCQGGRTHGYCRHRAYAIACRDLWGIDITRETVLGWGTDGMPVTQAMRDRELEEAA